ncbi:MAG: hypothetical protein CVU16_08450 [Betaproteobacteria bacterium HGW-Betaproteobacteria-10]|nr:MAG: hypothetical protein CVU16_08450 [Betaproteobacteria bacterium HGW-Betaproteobacteria-10]
MKDLVKKLSTDAWRTSGARYNASRRLKRRDLFSTISLSLFAAVGVGLAVVQRVYSFESGSPADNYITALSVCLGVFLLVVSLVEWGSGNAVKADRLYQNAEELNAFQRRLAVIVIELEEEAQPLAAEVQKLLKEYDEIKARCAFNHEPLDDCLSMATRRFAPEFKHQDGSLRYNWFEERWFAMRSIASSIWYFILLWLVIGGLIVATPWNQSGNSHSSCATTASATTQKVIQKPALSGQEHLTNQESK